MRSPWLFKLIFTSITVVAGVGVYWLGLDGEFIYDDVSAIETNPHIRHLWPLGRALTAPEGTGFSGRPLTALSFAVNYACSGLDVAGYRVVNVAIHILCALLIRVLVNRLLAVPSGPTRLHSWIAGITALVWVVHPLCTDAVLHVTYRHEQLMSLFYLATLCLAAAYIDHTHRGLALMSWLTCAFGMAAKENMYSAPVAVFLLHYVITGRSIRALFKEHRCYYLGLSSSWIVLCLSLASGSRGIAVSLGFEHLPLFNYILTQLDVTMYYLRLSLWPSVLVVDYWDVWPIADTLNDVLFQAVSVSLLVVLIVLGLKRRRVEAFVGFIFFAVLAPTSLIPNGGEVVAEHRMYLPLAALILLVVFLFQRLLEGVNRQRSVLTVSRVPLVGAVAVVLLSLGVRTHNRAADYQSALQVWSVAVNDWPGNPRAHHGLADALAAQHRYDEARYHYGIALQIKHDYVQVYNNFGQMLSKTDDVDGALTKFRMALAYDPNHAATHNNMGIAYSRLGRVEMAVQCFERALELDPGAGLIHLNLGMALFRLGRDDLAPEHVNRALRLEPELIKHEDRFKHVLTAHRDALHRVSQSHRVLQSVPGSADAHYQYATALAAAGSIDDAEFHYRRALQLDEDFIQALNDLGNLLRRRGQLDEAAACFNRVISQEPNHALAYNNIGLTLLESGQFGKAIEYFEIARRLDPTLIEVRNNLGIAYAQMGQWTKALHEFEAVLAENPTDHVARNNLVEARQRMAQQRHAGYSSD